MLFANQGTITFFFDKIIGGVVLLFIQFWRFILNTECLTPIFATCCFVNVYDKIFSKE